MCNVDSSDNSNSSWPKTERWVLHPSMSKACSRQSNSSARPITFQYNCSEMFKVACYNSINLNVINFRDFRELSEVLQHFTSFSFIFMLPESAWMKIAMKIDYKKAMTVKVHVEYTNINAQYEQQIFYNVCVK